MTIIKMIYSFFLMPIQLVFEIVFRFANKLAGHNLGIAIIALSLAINLLVLPLYMRADAMQEDERNIQAKLQAGVSHIKKTFKGDERTMVLQTYYRQNNYSPLHVMRSAVSLFLEIPFFIVAYRFLSGLDLLQGVSFGPIADLASPDGLLKIGGIAINVLPLVMTVINVISTAIFTKDYPLKTKIQLYGIAAFFLVFLYKSPSGLVFYWTLNNLFSLIKTLFYKLKNPKKVLTILAAVIGVVLVAFSAYSYFKSGSKIRSIAFAGIGMLCCVPLLYKLLIKITHLSMPKIKAQPDKKLFWIGATYLAVLMGLLIPSAVTGSSPQDFVIVGSSMHPIWYNISTFLIASGTFMLWFGVFYWLFSDTAKVIIERVIIIVGIVGTVNYLFFGKNYGTLTADLSFDSESISHIGIKTMLFNLLVIIAVTAVVVLILKLNTKLIKGIGIVAIVAMICMSGVNFNSTFKSMAGVDLKALSDTKNSPHITLSKDEDNVIVMMLDRAMGEYFPYILEEYPELKDTLGGFTYYSNVISYGKSTNIGSPALYGGYEYTPAEINKRTTESLVSKHNEALKVMPTLFSEKGYKVTVCDAPYANYSIVADTSIYDGIPNVTAYITQGNVKSEKNVADTINGRFRNFFFYSIFKISPVCAHKFVYNYGRYNQLDEVTNSVFDRKYSVLKNLSTITKIENTDNNCFVMMCNDTPHEAVAFSDKKLLTPYGKGYNYGNHPTSLTVNGITLDLSEKTMWEHFQTNAATLMRIGEWCNYLREQGVYDNTRIILVADHGRGLRQIKQLIIDDTAYADDLVQRDGDVEFYFPLLMMKDFNSNELKTSDEFMTNADVPTMATAGVIDSPNNPYTKKAINNNEKTAHDQYVFASPEYHIAINNGNTFVPGNWYSVHDSIWDKNNWKVVAENSVTP